MYRIRFPTVCECVGTLALEFIKYERHHCTVAAAAVAAAVAVVGCSTPLTENAQQPQQQRQQPHERHTSRNYWIYNYGICGWCVLCIEHD